MSIRNPRTEALARELAGATGGSLTDAITVAVEERLQRLKGARTVPDLAEEIISISLRCGAMPTIDSRTEDDILGYSIHGAPA